MEATVTFFLGSRHTFLPKMHQLTRFESPSKENLDMKKLTDSQMDGKYPNYNTAHQRLQAHQNFYPNCNLKVGLHL